MMHPFFGEPFWHKFGQTHTPSTALAQHIDCVENGQRLGDIFVMRAFRHSVIASVLLFGSFIRPVGAAGLPDASVPLSHPALRPAPNRATHGGAAKAPVAASNDDDDNADGPDLPMDSFETLVPLPGPEAWALDTWFNAVGGRNADETFGALTVRVAEAAIGRPYADPPSTGGAEVVNLRVDAFECVSFVESSLAVARCVWMQTPTASCFGQEIVTIRYRDGRIDGFPSRLHYFEDWLGDNARRGHMALLSKELGGQAITRHTAYMTDHQGIFPALKDATIYKRIAAMEHRLSTSPQFIVMREMIGAIEPRLMDGDIIAVTTRRSDILVRHAGLVQLGANRQVHLLHASSAHHRVTRTKETLAEYINRRPEREGILIARPTPPPIKKAGSQSAGR
jgi:hypothetical protein